MTTKSVRDVADAVRGKRVLVRVDFNVPIDEAGLVSDDTRIRAAIPTLELLVKAGARVVLLSHFGRPKGKPERKYSLSLVADQFAKLAPFPAAFLAETDTDAAIAATNALKSGCALLLENTRFLPGEEANDDALSKRLAQLGDVFVNDAFGAAHRAHASTAGVCYPTVPTQINRQ